MTAYEAICAQNPHLKIYPLTSESYARYGELLSPAPYEELLARLADTPIPLSGNTYVPAAEPLEIKSELSRISNERYAGVRAQIGFCNGHSHKINCVEYHNHEEIDLAGTDMVLFLGRLEDMYGMSIDTDRLACFFVPAGTVLTFLTGTLHFAPCQVHSSGFRCGVILQRGTNAPIPPEKRHGAYFAQSKWLIGHAESRQVREMHAACGLTGKNLEVFPID